MSSSSGWNWIGAAALGVTLGAPVAWSDDVPAPTPPASSIDVTGFVDGSFGYNFNRPSTRVNALHAFDVDHNSLEVDLVELAFEKKPVAASPAGFRVDLDFGPVANIVGAPEPSSNKDVLKYLGQAYVSYLLDGKVQLDFGKFVTPMGAEVVESKDDWNYTRSIQFGYAIPFYHTGLRATINPSDRVSIGAFLVNGWNNVTDNNNDKSVAGALTLKPTGTFTWVGTVMAGKEVGDTTRVLFDSVATLNATDKISVMGNVDYGKDGDARWWAVSGYLRVQATGALALSPRVEYYDDRDGFTTGTVQKLTTYTLTGEAKLGGALLARLDVRYDHSNVAFFEGQGTVMKKGQPTATIGVVYSFATKL